MCYWLIPVLSLLQVFVKPDLCFIFASYSNHDFEGKLQKKFHLKDFVYDIKKIEDSIYKLPADKVVTYSIINIILTDYRWNITEESKCGLIQPLDRATLRHSQTVSEAGT